MTALLAMSLAYAQTVPAGADVNDAVSVQLTRDGLDAMGQILPALAPAATPVDPQSGGSGCFASYDVRDLSVGLSFVDVTMVPEPGRLMIEADLEVWLNDASDPFQFDFELFCLSDNECPSWVRPFPVTVALPFSMSVAMDPATGERYIDAQLGRISVDNGLDNTHIELTGDCDTLDDVDQILGQFGLSFYDFILSIVEPFLLAEIQNQAGDIEAALEDALRNVRFEDTVALGDAEMDVLVEPFDIDITPDGLEIVLLGNMSADPAACVAANDPGGSAGHASDVPDIRDNPSGTQMIVHASDELANQGLYAVWRSGLLCYELGADSEIDLGLPLNNSLLGILGGAAFTEILPEEEKPIAIQTDPRSAPTAVYDGPNDLVVEVRELGVDFFTEVDFRQTRALGLTLEADAPVDLLFDASTGVLTADVGLAADDIVVIASHNELVVEASADIEESVGGLVDVLLDSLVGDALDGIAFTVPSFDGVGLTSLVVGPSGADGDWLGVSAQVGEVSYTGSGEGCDGGCSGGDTGGGCATGRGAAAMAFLVPMLLLRRRRA